MCVCPVCCVVCVKIAYVYYKFYVEQCASRFLDVG